MGEDKSLTLSMAGDLTKVHSHQGNLVQAEIRTFRTRDSVGKERWERASHSRGSLHSIREPREKYIEAIEICQ